ncbi:GNAT family N-acetyltransferase [Entomohabitans teleogrylli]|uniref:GNAT family N-acetyltransferase n=1 Tax=Entomohabitans teleogrylli TaxID=1384589 RepID=UPI00073D2E93|nr:GNAT family N-acetyltransferase [Entomohabitans teleogrylli]
MPQATIVHHGHGLGCEKLGKPLQMSWGQDNSAVLHWPCPLAAGWLRDALDQMFIAAPGLSAIVLPYTEWREEPQALALFAALRGNIIQRDTFWQLPLWLSAPRQPVADEMVFDEQRDIFIPRRPARPDGEVYRRYDPRVRHTLSLRVADPAQDAERFTRWMNDPRVAFFWEQSGALEVQRDYLERQLTSAHAFPLIGCFDDQPFGYFEIYWAAEDRIGRHYPWQPFDRGLHLLVGEQQWRGAHFVQSWLCGLSHYLLLDESRTRRLVLEPRMDNQRLFRHLTPAGYHTVKEFDFPHKRSRLVMTDRQRFFSEVGL